MYRYRILVVAGEAGLAAELSHQLTPSDYELVEHTSSGKRALILAEQLRPDLVLLNLDKESHLDSISLAKALKNISIPVVFVVDFIDKELLERVKDFQPNGYLFQPLNTVQLRLVLDLAFAQHQAEVRLQRLQQEQSTILSTTMEGFWLADMEGRILDVNDTYLRMTGYTRAEMLRMSISDLESNESKEEISAQLHKIIRTGYVRIERQHRCKNGNKIDLELSVTYLPTSGGRIFSFFRDITHRKQAEKAVSESRDLIIKVTDQVPGVVYQYRLYPDGRSCFPFSSSGMRTIYEVTPEEVREDATPVFGRLHPEDYLNIVAAIQASARTLEPFHCEFRVILPRQGLRWRLCNALPTRMIDGGTLWHGIISDITESKQAEEQIRKLSIAVEQSPASIVITDLNGAIEYVNPKFTQVTGYSSEEVLGKNPRVLKGDLTSPAEYRQLWETITRGTEWRGEFHNRTKNGEYYWESASISPIVNAEGQITHFLAVKEDITKQKALEAQVRQAQKMESVGLLAGGIAHDFNNILAAIMMHLSLLQGDPRFDSETQATLKELLDEANRASHLTRQLLTFSRKSILETRILDLNEVITHLLKMLSRLIGEHISLRFEPHPHLPVVEADLGMIEQIVMNLCVNARDAMPQGGMLKITLEDVQVTESYTRLHPEARIGQFVCLMITDTGCGMDKTSLTRIFEPFYTTKAPGKGSGLGLAVIHGVVSQHNGWVEVESEPGKGSTFRVFLPATTKRMAASISARPTALLRGGESILVVEDEAALRRVVARGLDHLGYCVYEARNGQEAMEVWKEHGLLIQLLLTDMVMPEGVTGLELAKRLRDQKPDLKVIICSGYSTELAERVHSSENEFVYLAKPYDINTLSKWIRDCLDAKE